MLPIRIAMSRRFCEASLTGLLLLGVVFGPLQAGPLPKVGVDDFRTLIDPRRAPDPPAAAAGQVLAEYRRRLRQAAADLPSLGEVSRVLLMSEWSSLEYEYPSSSVPLNQVRDAVRQKSDEAFKKAVRKLMAESVDSPGYVNQAIVAQIKRDVRLQLLDRLEERTRFFLSQGRIADRIAAANLLGDTINTSRRQDVSQYRGVSGVMATTEKDVPLSSRRFRQRLRSLDANLEKLITDPNTQVRVAAIRALSEMEKEPGILVALLRPLLDSQQSDAPTRRAAAEALGRILEVYTSPQIVKGRPEPYLKAVEQVMPAAADGLTDSDALVRRASLEACQRVAKIIEELSRDPLIPQRRTVFRPARAIVEAALPKLNVIARDPIPELRVGACHVLETFALTVQRMSYTETPAPDRGPNKPTPLPKKESSENKKQSSKLPSPSSQDNAPVVMLERPIKLRPEGEAGASRSGEIRPVSFRAQQPDELPPPAAVEDVGIQGTVQAMIANLKHADYRVRLAAVDTLETFGEQAEAAIPALVTALRDYNKFVRWSSARTLGRLSPRRADEVVPGLMRLLDDREDPSVRIAAIFALELYGEHAKKAVPLLARVINRGDKEYIMAIMQAIQGIGTDAAPALPNVAWILSDRTQPPSVRIEAARTLGRFGALAKDHLAILRDVMNNDLDEEVRNAASMAVLAIDRPLR